jgi:hypothetical protein
MPDWISEGILGECGCCDPDALPGCATSACRSTWSSVSTITIESAGSVAYPLLYWYAGSASCRFNDYFDLGQFGTSYPSGVRPSIGLPAVGSTGVNAVTISIDGPLGTTEIGNIGLSVTGDLGPGTGDSIPAELSAGSGTGTGKGDEVFFSGSGTPQKYTLTFSDGKVYGLAVALLWEVVGSFDVTITAQDSNGGSTSLSFTAVSTTYGAGGWNNSTVQVLPEVGHYLTEVTLETTESGFGFGFGHLALCTSPAT